MFIANYLTRLEGESSLQKRSGWQSSSPFASVAEIRSYLTEWLANGRPPISVLYEKGILPDPKRWTHIKPFLEHFFQRRLQQMKSKTNPMGEYGSNGIGILSNGTATYTPEMRASINALVPREALPSTIEDALEHTYASLEQMKAKLASLEVKRRLQLNQYRQIPKEALNLSVALRQDVKECLLRASYHYKEIEAMQTEGRQQVTNWMKSTAKSNYVQHLLTLLEMSHQAQAEVTRRNIRSALYYFAEMLSLCKHLEANGCRLAYERVLFLMTFVLENLRRNFEESLVAIRWGSIGLTSGTIPVETVQSIAFVEKDTIVPIASTEALLSPEYLNLLHSEKVRILSSLSEILFAQKVKCYALQFIERNVEAGTAGNSKKGLEASLTIVKPYPFLFDFHIPIHDFLGFEWLSAEILLRFRYHFQDSENPLNRLDKPEWAFRYIFDQFKEHCIVLQSIWPSGTDSDQRLDISAASVTSTHEASLAALFDDIRLHHLSLFNVIEGMSYQLVNGIQLFIKHRMNAIFSKHFEVSAEKVSSISTFIHSIPLESVAAATFLHTIQKYMEFQSKWRAIHDTPASNLFLCFDENHSVELDFIEPSTKQEADHKQKDTMTTAAIEQLPMGLLDIWVSFDKRIVLNKLSQYAANGDLLKRQPTLLKSLESITPLPLFSTIVIDLIESSADRLEYLISEDSKKRFCEEVIGSIIRHFRDLLRYEWNRMHSLLAEQSKAAILLDACHHLVDYLNTHFPYVYLIPQVCKMLASLKVRMIELLKEAYMKYPQGKLHRLQHTPNVLLQDIIGPLNELKVSLAVDCFETVLDTLGKALEETLLQFLLKEINFFYTFERLHFFVNNCDAATFALANLSAMPMDNKIRMPLISVCSNNASSKDAVKLLQFSKQQIQCIIPPLYNFAHANSKETAKEDSNFFVFDRVKRFAEEFLGKDYLMDVAPVDTQEHVLGTEEVKEILSSFGINHLSPTLALSIIEKLKEYYPHEPH